MTHPTSPDGFSVPLCAASGGGDETNQRKRQRDSSGGHWGRNPAEKPQCAEQSAVQGSVSDWPNTAATTTTN
eukprot:1572323-Alexandrium_andersonii.AAC.1